MSSTAQPSDPEHPLFLDRDLFNEVLDLMFAAIQKILFRGARPVARDSSSRRAIAGGVSAEDVLQDAAMALLNHPDVGTVRDWRAFAVTVGKNKAKDALDHAQKHLRGTDNRTELHLVSGDAEKSAADGTSGMSALQFLPDRNLSPEEEVIAIQSALSLRDLAREILDSREMKIFLEIKFLQRSRRQLGDELGLTPQRVGQLYEQASRHLEAHPRYPYKIPE